MNIKTLALATVASFGLASGASAVTLSVVAPAGSGTATFGNLATNYRACGPTDKFTECYNPNGSAAGLAENLTTYFSAAHYPGLTLDGPARVKVTFIGKEAGAINTAFSMGGGEIDNFNANLNNFFTKVMGAGTVNFNFSSDLGSSAGSAGFSLTGAIGFSAVTNGGRTVYAFFDDSGASNDRDWDDMVVRIDASVIPLPAAGWMLLAGLGGIAAIKRRKKA